MNLLSDLKVSVFAIASLIVAGCCFNANATPAAILTANNDAGTTTFTPGETVDLHWNAIDADQFSSSYSVNGGAPMPWIASSANGDRQISILPRQAGQTLTYTYTATDSHTGQSATSSVSLIVAASVQRSAIAIQNAWEQPVTYALLNAYPADYSSVYQVGYWPNFPAHETQHETDKIPQGYTQYFGIFYYYSATEFHDVYCRAAFSETPAQLKLILAKDFSSCQILP